MLQVYDITTKVFVNTKLDTADENKYTRIIEHVDAKIFHFLCIVADLVFRIKEANVN